jgi:hypothetical protein
MRHTHWWIRYKRYDKPADRTSDCRRLTRYDFLDERIIANALADGGDTTKAITVPVPASSGYHLQRRNERRRRPIQFK